MPDAAPSSATVRWIVLTLVFLLLVGGSLRLGALDYAEFHGDEARSALRAAAVIQGQEDALLLHRKAPGEILVPTAVFALAGHLDEVSARLLFALAGIGALGAVFLLGWRMFGPITGGFAALILAMDGYLIGFARFVQYQSIVLLLSVLIVLIAYRIYRQPAALTAYLTLAALFFGAALLFHYDALLAALPAAFLLGAALWQKRIGWRRTGKCRASGSAAWRRGGGPLLCSICPAPKLQRNIGLSLERAHSRRTALSV